MLLSSFRSLVGQCPAAAAVAITCLVGLRSHASDAHRSAGRFHCVWEKVLLSARSNPEKLHDVVDVLSMHCITTQTAPPLDSFNELLRLCDAHGDVASAHKLTQMAMAVSMHLDEHTFTRMQSLFQYFPRPFPESARTASSSSSSHAAPSSSSSSSKAAAPAAHGAGSSSSSSGTYTRHSSTSYPGGVSNSSNINSTSSSSTGLKGVWVPLSSSAPGPHASAGAGAAAAGAGAAAAAAGGSPVAAASAQHDSSSRSSSSGEDSTTEAPSFGRYGPSGRHGRMRD